LEYDEKPAEMSVGNENEEENLKETSNEYKLAEEKTEQEQAKTLPTQNKPPENTQNGVILQTEKDQNLPTTAKSQKNESVRTQKYPTFAPRREKRALNKDFSYEYKSIYLVGQIFDEQSKQALRNVKVSLKEQAISTFSDSLGKFYFEVPKSGKYQIILELPEYRSLESQAQAEKENIFYLKKQK